MTKEKRTRIPTKRLISEVTREKDGTIKNHVVQEPFVAYVTEENNVEFKKYGLDYMFKPTCYMEAGKISPQKIRPSVAGAIDLRGIEQVYWAFSGYANYFNIFKDTSPTSLRLVMANEDGKYGQGVLNVTKILSELEIIVDWEKPKPTDHRDYYDNRVQRVGGCTWRYTILCDWNTETGKLNDVLAVTNITIEPH